MAGHPARQKLIEILEVGEFEGIRFTVLSPNPIKDGDTYLVARNTGPHLLTAKKVDHENGWVVPEEDAYVFDISECIPIQLHI